MPETINTQFDPEALPEWARAIPEVVWLCKRSVEFRVDVSRAETEQYRRALIREARRRVEA